VVSILDASERFKVPVHEREEMKRRSGCMRRKYLEMMRSQLALHLVDTKPEIIKEKELDGAHK
jgi:uncharacterized protein YnzC (UPF0291/DUF896 family)